MNLFTEITNEFNHDFGKLPIYNRLLNNFVNWNEYWSYIQNNLTYNEYKNFLKNYDKNSIDIKAILYGDQKENFISVFGKKKISDLIDFWLEN